MLGIFFPWEQKYIGKFMENSFFLVRKFGTMNLRNIPYFICNINIVDFVCAKLQEIYENLLIFGKEFFDDEITK